MNDPWERLRELLYDGDPNGLHWSGNETDDDIVEVVKFWLNEVGSGVQEKFEYGHLSSGILFRTPGKAPKHRRIDFGTTPWEPVE